MESRAVDVITTDCCTRSLLVIMSKSIPNGPLLKTSEDPTQCSPTVSYSCRNNKNMRSLLKIVPVVIYCNNKSIDKYIIRERIHDNCNRLRHSKWPGNSISCQLYWWLETTHHKCQTSVILEENIVLTS